MASRCVPANLFMVGRWSEGLVMGGVISVLNVLFLNHKLLQQIIAHHH